MHRTNDRKRKKLSKELPFVQNDFYELDDRIYVGELTLYQPENGKGVCTANIGRTDNNGRI
jgi:hypothetical protein